MTDKWCMVKPTNEEEDFKIDSDSKAEWAIMKIKEEQCELDRYINVCQDMITQYEEKIKKQQEQFENKTSYLKSELARYFNKVKTKKTKTQETYKLPSGTLKLKYGKEEFIKDEEKLLHWLESNCPDYIKTKKSIDWSNLKKSLIIKDDVAITNDGEIVEGIKIQKNESKFVVESK